MAQISLPFFLPFSLFERKRKGEATRMRVRNSGRTLWCVFHLAAQPFRPSSQHQHLVFVSVSFLISPTHDGSEH